MSETDILHKDVMGFPIWVVAILGVGVFFVVKKFTSSGSNSGVTLVSSGAGAGGVGAVSGANPTTSGGNTPTVSTSASAPTGLETWLAAAQSALQQAGYDAQSANQALQDYIAGNPLPQGEYAIVNAANKLAGAAPGLGSPTVQTTSTGTPPSTPQNSGFNFAAFIPKNLNAPIVAFENLVSGGQVALGADGGIFTGNGAQFYGSAQPTVSTMAGVSATGLSVDSKGGYTVTLSNGQTLHYGP